jgi:ketosteroid isomerase-like protein
MKIKHPQLLHNRFVMVFNRGDIDGLLDLYEAGATLVSEPGKTVKGTAAIRASLQDFLALKGKMEITTAACVECGDVAMTRGRWTLSYTGPDGKPAELSGGNLEVVRKQLDGSWRILIDDPYGGA